jgi:16S rRNA (guanine527-N7)-methyltransferase
MAYSNKRPGGGQRPGAPKGSGQGKDGGSAGPQGAAQGRTSRPHKPAHRPVAWTAAQWAEALPPVLSTLGLAPTAQQAQQLAAYMVMLSHWNSTYNLTALRDPQDMLSHHLSDCLAVLAPLARHLAARAPEPTAQLAAGGDTAAAGAASTGGPQAPALRVLDVGSGGGLPGVVLAICQPGVHVTCVDTVGKKAAFIRQVAAELGLPNLKAVHARVEELDKQFDLITSRAFASLLDFVSLTRALLADGAVWMAMKGKQPDEELEALPADVSVFHVEQLDVPGLDAQRCLVWMRPH